MSDRRFSDFDLHEDLTRAIAQMGYEHPTPVQAASIPLVATGCDLMVQSQTGTGKTAAFAIPTLDALMRAPTQRSGLSPGVRAMVLCPTRELARQVADEFNALSQHSKVQAVAIYGGASMEKQVAELRFAQVVVGTPGRVLDHLRRGTFNLKKLTSLILDEADEMLSMGFAEELDRIMSFVPDQRQTLLFSATIPPDIKSYAQRYMRAPEFLSLIEENVAADDVEHRYYIVSGVGRPQDLLRVIEYEQPDSAIIFANTRRDSEVVAQYLKRQGYNAEYLNGDLAQNERERIMRSMKEKDLRFLVATDIAARGIDISELSHVINYVLPDSPESYIHRTGRTGRAGRQGTAISLIGPREIGVYYSLKRIYKVALEEHHVPTQAEIDLRREELRTQALVQEILSAVRAPEGAPLLAALRDQTLRLLERDDALEIVQALLGHFQQKSAAPAPKAAFGGVLAQVPKPERVEPGALPQTLQRVADRINIVTGEFRGLPASRAAKSAEAAPKSAEVAPKSAEVAPKSPEAAPKSAEVAPKSPEAAPKSAEVTPKSAEEPRERFRSRRRRSGAEPAAAAPVEPVAAAAEPEPVAPVAAAAAEPEAAEARTARRPRRRPSAQARHEASSAPAAVAPVEPAAAPAKSEPVEPAAAPAKPAAVESAAAPAPRGASRLRSALRSRRGEAAPEVEARTEAPLAEPPAEPTAAPASLKSRLRQRRQAHVEAPAQTAPAPVAAPVQSAPPPRAAAPAQSAPPAPVAAHSADRRLFINLGRQHGLSARRIGELLAQLGGIYPEDFRQIDLRERFSYLIIPAEFAEDLIMAVNGETVERRTLRIEFARDH